jgi:hypothetical protein
MGKNPTNKQAPVGIRKKEKPPPKPKDGKKKGGK